MPAVDCQRPPKLYQYSNQQVLQRSLTLGEFRLHPVSLDATAHPQLSSEQILPFRTKKAAPGVAGSYLALSLAQAWDEKLFDVFPDADCCLVIDNPEEFGERIHRAAQRALPQWAGIDAAISYGMPSPLGVIFSKTKQFSMQKEWLFAWRPIQPRMPSHPIVIQIGSIENIAQLRTKIP